MVAKVYPNADLSAFVGMPAQAGSDAAPLKCPRSDSSNTKFCYFNNYSLAQPRHFCKACKRYWTRGGTLRNVPVGGGCRKNKRNKKPQSATLVKEQVRWSANSLPIPAAELSSMIYGMPSTNSPNLFFPGFDLGAQLSGYEEAFRSGIGARRGDLQQAEAGGEYCRDPLRSSDDLSMGISEGLDLAKGIPMDALYSLGGSGFPGTESSNLNWNQAGFIYGWPEYGSSVAPLV